MEAINILAGALGMKPNFFSTAGTKDRRAVTVQRVSIRGRDPKKVLSANAKLRGLAIGDFKFSDKDLFLGSHNGNEFTIVLKDCTFQGAERQPFEKQLENAQLVVDRALADITKHGFINYFGTQRFGTYEIGTQTIGMKILQGDLKGVVQDLLSFDPDMAAADPNTLQGDNARLTDMYRAKALSKYKDSNDPEAAAKLLPKRCNTEFAILKHLSKQSNDYHGAVLAITRNMRNMYLHAYQSLVWNFVASKRWELFGASVVEGDLVFAKTDDTQCTKPVGQADYDDEENIHLTEAGAADDSAKQNVRVLSASDVASGRYTIRDVVLSIPGTDVIYPDNEVGKYYKEFMSLEGNGGLDPHNMYRPQKAFSLTGDYRKFMGTFIGSPSGSVHRYSHDNEQLVPTDLDLIRARQSKTRTEAAAKANRQAPSAWNAFAQKVQDVECKQAKDKLANAQRRKAESMENDVPEVRLNETWIQTTVDGTNKRVKVDMTNADSDNSDDRAQKGDAVETEKHAKVAQEGSVVATTEVEMPKQAQIDDTATLEVSTIHCPGTERSLFIRLKKVLLQLYDSILGNIVHIFNTDKLLRKPSKQKLQLDQATDDEAMQAIADTPMTDAPSTTLIRENPSSETVHNQALQDKSSPSTEQQKIAVVLKFSLGSSAYATMVLRELQG
jgi:tRNA pseudouridine13 synthase